MNWAAIFIILASSTSALAKPIPGPTPNCDCPSVDPLAVEQLPKAKNSKCPSNPPKGMAKMERVYPAAGCTATGDFFAPTSNNWVKSLIGPLGTIGPKPTELSSPVTPKEPEELLSYLNCYTAPGDQEHFCHFKMSLSKYIGYASKVSRLPFEVQACLFFKENSFHKGSSGVGAMGYVQIMPNTVKDLNAIISETQKDYLAQLTENYARLKKFKSKAVTPKYSATQKKMDLNSIRAEITKENAKLKARQAWDRYWAGTDPSLIPHTTKKKVKGKLIVEKPITSESSSCYRLAFILSMMKQVYDLGLMSDDVSSFKINKETGFRSINGMNETESAVYLAGAYNKGGPGFANICGNKNLKSCIESLPKDNETRQQMQGVRNCVQRNSEAPTQDPYHPERSQRNCNERKCK